MSLASLDFPGSTHCVLARTFPESPKLIIRYFITTSKDMKAMLWTLDPLEGFKPKSFAGHRDVVLGAWFSADEKTVS